MKIMQPSNFMDLACAPQWPRGCSDALRPSNNITTYISTTKFGEKRAPYHRGDHFPPFCVLSAHHKQSRSKDAELHSMTRPSLFTLYITLKDFESGLVGLDSKSGVRGATICLCESKSMLRTMRLFNFLHHYFAYSCAERRHRCTVHHS